MNMDVPLVLLLVAELSTEVSRVGLRVARRKTCNQGLQHAHGMRLLKLLLLIGFDETGQLRVDLIVCPDSLLKVL